MRVTNNMIMDVASININGTKVLVNDRNNQMTTQKKINRPSDDPVIAVRSLRLGTALSKAQQYYDRNIPDAKSWLDVTETALSNMVSIFTDVRTNCVNGATDTLTQDDRNTILTQLSALQSQVYNEGNSDYASRTVFTGFRTDKEVVFSDQTEATGVTYDINEKLSWTDMEEFRYYTGNVEVPSTKAGLDVTPSDTVMSQYYRVRLSYTEGDITDSNGEKIDPPVITKIVGDTKSTIPLKSYASQEDWLAASTKDPKVKEVDDNDAIYIKETGEIIFGKDLADGLRTDHADISVDYKKKGFSVGELRPEYYFDCTATSADGTKTQYQRFDPETGDLKRQEIQYTVAANQLLTINTEATDVFDQRIQRDIGEMISCVSRSINAHDKIDEIKSMMKESQYADEDSQKKLQGWLEAAQKEADFADDDMQKLFSTEIGKVDEYLAKVNLGVTKLGCAGDSLAMTQTRMSDQKETIISLQSQNDDVNLSDIMIDYTAAYTAYQASLTAASKLGQNTLLNYI